MPKFSKKYLEANKSLVEARKRLIKAIKEYREHSKIPSKYILEVGMELGKAKVLTKEIPNFTQREECEVRVDKLESISYKLVRAIYFSENALKDEAVMDFILSFSKDVYTL